jgi:hypothetical protein
MRGRLRQRRPPKVPGVRNSRLCKLFVTSEYAVVHTVRPLAMGYATALWGEGLSRSIS